MADTTIGTPVAIATPDLQIIDGQITTTSNQLAAHFGKIHRDVVRAIENIECSKEFRLRNFAQSSFEADMPNGGKRTHKAYRLTRDGFVFLAMGFTGKDAAQWKEAYISAFNQMEQKLLEQSTRPINPAIDYDRISPAQKQDLKEIVDAIVKAGVQTYSETWARLQKKFRVNSYLELPATQHLEARAYLLAKLPKASTAPAPTDLQTICFAATHASVLVHAKVFRALQHNAQPNAQECLRFMLTIDLKELRNSPARLTDLHTFTHEVAHGECLIPTTDLLALAYACNSRAHKRLHGNSPHAIAE